VIVASLFRFTFTSAGQLIDIATFPSKRICGTEGVCVVMKAPINPSQFFFRWCTALKQHPHFFNLHIGDTVERNR